MEMMRLLIGLGIFGVLIVIGWKLAMLLEIFFTEEPFKRSKQVVELYKIKYEAEQAIHQEMKTASIITKWLVKRELHKNNIPM